jgi:hypothetical protein
MNWTDMDVFRGVDLNDSFVLNWFLTQDLFVIEIEASLWPKSKFYSAPVNDEYTCYKKASILFQKIKSIEGLIPINTVTPTIDADGSNDYGNIDSLILNNAKFHVAGSFGNVVINGGEVTFSVST